MKRVIDLLIILCLLANICLVSGICIDAKKSCILDTNKTNSSILINFFSYGRESLTEAVNAVSCRFNLPYARKSKTKNTIKKQSFLYTVISKSKNLLSKTCYIHLEMDKALAFSHIGSFTGVHAGPIYLILSIMFLCMLPRGAIDNAFLQNVNRIF